MIDGASGSGSGGGCFGGGTCVVGCWRSRWRSSVLALATMTIGDGGDGGDGDKRRKPSAQVAQVAGCLLVRVAASNERTTDARRRPQPLT